MKRKLKKSAKIGILFLSGAVLICAGYVIYRVLDKRSKESLSLEFAQDKLVFEAKEPLPDYAGIFQSPSEFTVEGNVDIDHPGTYPLKVIVHGKDLLGRPKDSEYSCNAAVQDTTAPKLEIDETRAFILSGGEFDPLSHVISAADTVDGDLTAISGAVYRKDQEDLTKPGEHTIVIGAKDSSGNESEASYVLATGKSVEGKNPYLIRINRVENNVTVYMMDEDEVYSLPARAMVCSTGTATPIGSFNTFNRGTWRSLFGGVAGQYVTDIVGDILFHSVPYFSMDKGNLEYEEYNKLGTKASLGCIRLCVRDAKWIFDECPIGTTVEIYDKEGDPGPLGKPEPIKIDVNDERRGWDPTDPDPENSWNN